MIKLIIFDWDDVFSQGSTGGYYKCYHEAVSRVGITLTPEQEKERIASKWGSSHKEEIEALLAEHPELVDKACEAYEEHLFGNTFVDCLTFIPGSPEMLQRLSKKYTLAIASGVHRTLLEERVMKKFGIDPALFAEIITAYDLDDPTKAKPHPHSAETIMQRTGHRPEETIMVGDAENDVKMARNAGIEPVVVLTGHLSRAEAEALQVRHILQDVTLLEKELETF